MAVRGATHRFDGQVAIVTGAGAGMGRAHALLLASRGARVIVNDLPSPIYDEGAAVHPCDSLVREIESAGGQAVSALADVATEGGAVELVTAAIEEFGRLDVVVNNAGIMQPCAFPDMSSELFQHTFAVNALGPFLVMKQAWPHLVSQNYGRIVCVCSTAGMIGMPERVHYASSKGALIAMTRALAAEAHDSGVCVNAVLPSALTGMSTASARQRVADRFGLVEPSPEDWARLATITAGQVAPVIAWLAHESCSVNGEIWQVGGGRIARVLAGATAGYSNEELEVEDVARNLDAVRVGECHEYPNYDLLRPEPSLGSGSA